MVAELTSTEQIFTETSRLVPLGYLRLRFAGLILGGGGGLFWGGGGMLSEFYAMLPKSAYTIRYIYHMTCTVPRELSITIAKLLANTPAVDFDFQLGHDIEQSQSGFYYRYSAHV